MLHVLRAFATRGAPARGLAHWRGRWWSLGGPADLLPAGDRVLAARELRRLEAG